MIISKGFSLIELMIIVAIIGILTMIAMPSYQKHVAEGLSLAKPAIVSMTEYYSANGKFQYTNSNHNQLFDNNSAYSVDPAASFFNNATERVMIGKWWAPMGITIDYSKEKLGLSKWGDNPSQKPMIMLIVSPMVTSNKRVLGNGAKWDDGAIEWKCILYFMPRIIAPSVCQELSHQVYVKKKTQTVLHVTVLVMERLVHSLLILMIKKALNGKHFNVYFLFALYINPVIFIS